MTTNTSYIAGSTSDLAERFSETVEANERRRTADELLRLHEKIRLINDLSRRGMLNRQEYESEPSLKEFEKLYMTRL